MEMKVSAILACDHVSVLVLTSENHLCAVPQGSNCTDRAPTTQVCVVAVIWKERHVYKETICWDW